jgi:hypothetical protein
MVFHKSPAFHQFTHEFRGKIVIPSDPDYKHAIARWSLLAERDAGVITFPENAEDVVLAIKFAVSQDLEVAIRGELTVGFFMLTMIQVAATTLPPPPPPTVES